jgi:hypothetical protein
VIASDFVPPPSIASPGPSPTFNPNIPVRGDLILIPECPAGGCPVCSGPKNGNSGCTMDSQCAPQLMCYKDAGEGFNQISGCSGKKDKSYGYCFSPNATWKPPPVLQTEVPKIPLDIFNITFSDPGQCEIHATKANKKINVTVNGESSKFFFQE